MKKGCELWMNVTASNNDSCLLAEQRIWGISVQVSSSIQKTEKETLCMSPAKKRSIQAFYFEKDQNALSYFLKFSQLLVSSEIFELCSLTPLYITRHIFSTVVQWRCYTAGFQERTMDFAVTHVWVRVKKSKRPLGFQKVLHWLTGSYGLKDISG